MAVRTFLAIWLAVAVLSLSALAATFNVNSTTDTNDANPGNGVCQDGGGVCTLRAAVDEANALAGADVIILPAGTYTHTLAGREDANAGDDYDITGDLTINGAGSGSTTIVAMGHVAGGGQSLRSFGAHHLSLHFRSYHHRGKRALCQLEGGRNQRCERIDHS